MPRYEYKFVRIGKQTHWGWLSKRQLNDYQTTIKDETRTGWRFVQAFAPAVYGYGAARYIDLIFERELDGAAHRPA